MYELSFEIAGHNARWEQSMQTFRLLYALIYNVNAPKGKQKTAKQLIPLPSESVKSEFDKRIEELTRIAEIKAFAKKR